MTERWSIVCDDAELAVEASSLANQLGLDFDPEISVDPITRAVTLLQSGPVAVALGTAPKASDLITLSNAARAMERPVPLALVCPEVGSLIPVALDLGLVAVEEMGPLLAASALLAAGADHPWTASARGLTPLDRTRLGDEALVSGRGGGKFERVDDGGVGWKGKGEIQAVGRPRDLGAALRALRSASAAGAPYRAVIEGVDLRAVQEVIFGPPRALSDPASKAALAPYGLPLPIEELCTSPSRAAAEAARIGFPVRISLASPDLRIWDHRDLAVDGVDNAARVRDVYRQIMAMAHERSDKARLLGVHVTATTSAQALLRVVACPLVEGYVLATIGFADPHGRASNDVTSTVLPADAEAVGRALRRLAGRQLLLAGPPPQQKAVLAALADVLLRLTAFIDAHDEAVERVELNPVALLIGGAAEVRESCVTVGDAFLRTLR